MSRQLDKTELLHLSRPFSAARNAKRQRQVRHLHACGVRPVLECLIDVAAGRDLDEACEKALALPHDHPRLRPYQNEANAAVERASIVS